MHEMRPYKVEKDKNMWQNKKININKILIWKSPATLRTPRLTLGIIKESAEERPQPAISKSPLYHPTREQKKVATSEGSSSPGKNQHQLILKHRPNIVLNDI